jgi:hypothetical protein
MVGLTRVKTGPERPPNRNDGSQVRHATRSQDLGGTAMALFT